MDQRHPPADSRPEPEWLADRAGAFSLQDRYRRHAIAYVSPLARRLRVLEPEDFVDMLEDAVDAGLLTDDECQTACWASVVLTGRRHQDAADIVIMIDVAPDIGPQDVERTIERAALLAKLGRPVIPVVGGYTAMPEARELARARGVYLAVGEALIPPTA